MPSDSFALLANESVTTPSPTRVGRGRLLVCSTHIPTGRAGIEVSWPGTRPSREQDAILL